MNTIDVDTGGTFTDGVFRHGGRIVTTKVDTTPQNPVRCFVDCIESGARLLGMEVSDLLQNTDVIRYSTTAATNAIIQRRGAKIGLLVSSGHEKSLYQKPDELAPIWPLLEPGLIRGIPESVDDAGMLTTGLDPGAFRTATEELLDNGARLLVVALRNAALNPANELAARDLFRQWFPTHYLGAPFLILSHQVSSRGGNAERLNSAVISGYLHRQLVIYLYKCDQAVRSRGYNHPLLVVHSSGGLARVAKTKALNTYNSGPTAGVYGAARIARRYNFPHVLTMDIGGTSTDVAFIENGNVRLSFDVEIEGIPVNLPMIDVLGLGGGGGSLVRVEKSQVKVGPDSAGAVPGPACYDLGNSQPTVTDADLVLGIIDSANFLGGKRHISVEKARKALDDAVAKPLATTVEAAALTVRQVLADALAVSIRSEARRRKFLLADSILFAYGGAGPLHAADVADALGVRTFYVFPESPVFSAAGCSSMNVEHLYETRVRAHNDASLDQALSDAINELKLRAGRDMRGEGLDLTAAKVRAVLEAPDGSEVEYIAGETRSTTATGMHDVILRVSATLERDAGESLSASASPPAEGMAAQRDIHWPSGRCSTAAASFPALAAGMSCSGPLVIESGETTCVVPPGWTAEKDRYGAVCVKREASS